MKRNERLMVVVTAGPTREYIDPVRFISNASSGKMGYCLAEEAVKSGNKVVLISGPVSLAPPKNIKTIFVNSAQEMHKETIKLFPGMDIFISTAAVCDFTSTQKKLKHKLKSKSKRITLKLKPNIDILYELGKKVEPAHQCIGPGSKTLVGFALETENLLKNAIKKLNNKNLDLIIANPSTSIAQEYTQGFTIERDGKIQKISRTTKTNAAKTIWSKIKKVHERKIRIIRNINSN